MNGPSLHDEMLSDGTRTAREADEREWDWLLNRVRWAFPAVGLTLVGVGLLNDGPWHVVAGSVVLIVGIAAAARFLRGRKPSARRVWVGVFVSVLLLGLLSGLLVAPLTGLADAVLLAVVAGLTVAAALALAPLAAPEDVDA